MLSNIPPKADNYRIEYLKAASRVRSSINGSFKPTFKPGSKSIAKDVSNKVKIKAQEINVILDKST